jgi:putative MATE family efflux protein
MKDRTDLTKGSIMTHIREISIPASTGLIFTTLYNATDTYFAGQKVGVSALAGITLAFPIYFIISAIGNGLGSGSTALLSISLGQKDKKKYHSLMMNSVILGLIASLILIIVAPFIIKPLLNLAGGEGQTLKEGLSYLTVMFYGSVFFIMNGILNGILNSQGDTKSYRNFLIIGFFLNLILDPLFVMGWFGLPEMGSRGVALATVIIMAVGSVYLSFRVLRSSGFAFDLFKKQKLVGELVREILSQSIPQALNTATAAIGVFVINFWIMKLSSGPNVIAAYGAAMRIEQFILVPTFGLNTAAVTLTGQNFGAKDYDRVREVKSKIMRVGMIMVWSLSLLMYPFAGKLIAIFNNDPDVITQGIRYLRIALLAEPTYIIMGLDTSILAGIKKPHYAVALGLYRQLIMPYILITILVNVFAMDIGAVWWSIFAVNWSGAIFTIFYTNHVYRSVLK